MNTNNLWQGPEPLVLQPVCDVVGRKLWLPQSVCWSVGVWGLSGRHPWSQAVVCLWSSWDSFSWRSFFGIRSSSIWTTWPSQRTNLCLNMRSLLFPRRLYWSPCPGTWYLVDVWGSACKMCLRLRPKRAGLVTISFVCSVTGTNSGFIQDQLTQTIIFHLLMITALICTWNTEWYFCLFVCLFGVLLIDDRFGYKPESSQKLFCNFVSSQEEKTCQGRRRWKCTKEKEVSA